MEAFSSCCGQRRKPAQDESEPLLADYEDDTALQRRLHEKLHSYQMVRALAAGYMPSTEQLIINLRTLLASDFFNPGQTHLSRSGRLLVKFSKQLITEFSDVLREKNGEDQLQDILWLLSQSRVSVDTEIVPKSAAKLRKKAQVTAVSQSFRTVGSLLLTNADFRVFLGDVTQVARQVFADTTESLSKSAQEASSKLALSDGERQALQEPESKETPPTTQDLEQEVNNVSKAVDQAVVDAGQQAVHSLQENLSGVQRETLLRRLKDAVTKLRTRPDYADSVSTISKITQDFLVALSQVPAEAIETTSDTVDTNIELEQALKKAWELISAFGDREKWDAFKNRLIHLRDSSVGDEDFNAKVSEASNSIQRLLMDPSFYDEPEKGLNDLREKAQQVEPDTNIEAELRELTTTFKQAVNSAINDPQLLKLITTGKNILSVLMPANNLPNKDLFEDALQYFLPLLIKGIQYLPIPRVEISMPEADLLLENLILEPGRTVNQTSFFPFKLSIQTLNDIEIRKTHTLNTAVSSTHHLRITLAGFSIRAEDIGYMLNLHSFLPLSSSGIASFSLDERGIDIALDIEIGRERLEHILTLRKVRVHIHKLSYTLRQTSFSWLAWALKPILLPTLRHLLEKTLAQGIADFFHAANRELLFARERLRATRISNPDDLRTFIRAVITRLTPEENPDLYAYVGVTPNDDRFKGVYAPGSLVKLWEEEAARAGERVEDGQADVRGGWRNEVFDVKNTRSVRT